MPGCSTSFARLTRTTARVVLVLSVVATAAFVAVTLSPIKSGYADGPERGPGDLALYRAEAGRIRAGEGYYAAANVELRQRGYPTRSLFNWRTPLPMWLLGKLPQPWWGRFLLGSLALLAFYGAFTLVEREGGVWQGVGCGLLLIGAMLPCVLEDIYVAPELWSAVMIVLSLCAYQRQWPIAGVWLAVAALFFRELAGLYCLTMGLMALARRQWGELLWWFVGLVVYAAFFAWHAANVLPLIGADDVAHRGSWLQLGGLPFLLSLCQMSAYLLLLPQWVTAMYFIAALLGLAGWSSSIGQRVSLATCAYLALFAAVGHPFNQYWGALFAPLLCFGVARLPASLIDLWQAATLRTQNIDQGCPLPSA